VESHLADILLQANVICELDIKFGVDVALAVRQGVYLRQQMVANY